MNNNGTSGSPDQHQQHLYQQQQYVNNNPQFQQQQQPLPNGYAPQIPIQLQQQPPHIQQQLLQQQQQQHGLPQQFQIQDPNVLKSLQASIPPQQHFQQFQQPQQQLPHTTTVAAPSAIPLAHSPVSLQLPSQSPTPIQLSQQISMSAPPPSQGQSQGQPIQFAQIHPHAHQVSQQQAQQIPQVQHIQQPVAVPMNGPGLVLQQQASQNALQPPPQGQLPLQQTSIQSSPVAMASAPTPVPSVETPVLPSGQPVQASPSAVAALSSSASPATAATPAPIPQQTPTDAPEAALATTDATSSTTPPPPQEFIIPKPETREQYQLLLLRWNALNSVRAEQKTHDAHPEYAAICKIIRQAGREQKLYQSRLDEIKAAKAKLNKKLDPSNISLLSTQIKAFQLLTHNLDIPTKFQEVLLKSCVHEDEDQKPSLFSPSPIVSEQYRQRLARINAPLPGGVSHKRASQISASDHEKIVSNKISQRIVELERLPGNLGTLDTETADLEPSNNIPSCDDELKTKALIELKSLRLLTKQKTLRQNVVFSLATTTDPLSESMTLRYTNRRQKLHSLQDLRITEQLETQQRAERERKEHSRHLSTIKGICLHAKQVLHDRHSKHQKHLAMGRAITQTHINIEKEEQKRAERTAKQRLQALKANDEEAYIKLLDQTKDTRITHILGQTNSFLDSLAQRVKVQQLESDPIPLRTKNDDDDDDDEKERVDYYEVSHRIKEVVTKQPSILVGGTLKEYQIKGLQWMVSLYNNNLNGILADEMGLGKTIQSVSLITYLIEVKKRPGPYLVIVPLSTLTNWTLEFEKWAPSVKKIVYKGPPLARRVHHAAIRAGDFQVLLTTYEYIIKDRPILGKIKWIHMIIDEGHRMKNSNSKLSSTLTQYYTSTHRLILTGTPLQNSLPELWALLNFVLPKIFNSVKTFDEWFNTPFSNTGGQDKMELNEEETLLIIRRLHKVLRPFLLRRLKKDVEKDLPDKVEKVVKCKMSALQSKLYQQMIKHNVLLVGQDGVSGNKSGVKGLNNRIMQLRKICNHPFVFEETENLVNPSHITNDNLWRVAGKFELLDRVLPKFKATGHRVLMFFQMTQVMDIMEDYMRYRNMKYLRLDGSTKADERSEMLKVFNAPNSEYFAFLLSTRAGGLGLNLQTADTVIIYDTDWNPHQDLQAQDRAHRIGQTKEVRILRLITEDSVEESILSRAHSKLEIDGKVIQAGKFDQKSTAEEQEAFLRLLLEAEVAKRNQKVDDEDMDDDELNEILARNENEAEFFRKMDEERNATSPYGRDKPKDRLFGEDELPEELKRDIAETLEQPQEQETLGRGARERKKVFYDDVLSEEQWLEAMDNDDDTVEDAIERERVRKERLRERREARRAGDSASGLQQAGVIDDDDDDADVQQVEDDDDDEDKQDYAPQSSKKRKRGPSRRVSPSKIVDDDNDDTSAIQNGSAIVNDSDEEDIEKPSRRRGHRLSNNINVSLDMVTEMGQAIISEITECTDEDGRTRVDLFLELPNRRNYPDYYKLIKRPIALDKIQKKLETGKYLTVDDMAKDLQLMAANALKYNEANSLVYQDAQTFEKMVEEWRERSKRAISEIDASNGTSSVSASPKRDDEDEDDDEQPSKKKRTNRNTVEDDEDEDDEDGLVANGAAAEELNGASDLTVVTNGNGSSNGVGAAVLEDGDAEERPPSRGKGRPKGSRNSNKRSRRK